jgi:tetratricopeptide (TPR) repeat protein
MTDTKKIMHEAMELHRDGDLDKAAEKYKMAIEQNSLDKRVFTNYAAILRNQGNPEEAAKVASKGIELCDKNSPILHNTLANALRDLKRYDEAINMYRYAIRRAPDYFDPKISLICCLKDAGYKTLSKLSLRAMIANYGVNNKKLINQLITNELEEASSGKREINEELETILKYLDQDDNEKPSLHWFTVAQILSHKEIGEEAIKYYMKGVDILKNKLKTRSNINSDAAKEIYTISSWNFGCSLLRIGFFEKGWELFDHGLRTPANPPQRWQRSLYKPYSFNKIKMWRGEMLKGKNILLLGEQGIGDSMMFITLIPKLISEGARISILVPVRLAEIYKRSLPNCDVYSDEEFRKEAPDAEKFDYQCPLGSVPRYRYRALSDFEDRNFALKSDENKTKELKRKYLQNNSPKNKIIGISWQGGGTKDRINDKSAPLNKILEKLKPFNFTVVSLQYGNDAEIVKKHASAYKMDFIDDEEIQATKDMNSWLNQVDACDAVISIANTTIHGAGGLRKPTLCLLGIKADWRWLKARSSKKSYWYPTVDVEWQEENRSWDAAIDAIAPWLKKHKLIDKKQLERLG